MARKTTPCKWPGCRKPKRPGNGKHYCTAHQLLCKRVGGKTRTEARRQRAVREQAAEDALAAHLEIEEAAHQLAVRMLAGKS